MAYFAVDAVEVRAWGEPVGAVALDPGTGYYAFEYFPSWRGDLAPGLMPLGGGPYVFPQLAVDTFHRLPAMLADRRFPVIRAGKLASFNSHKISLTEYLCSV